MSSENTPGPNPPSPGKLNRRASYAPGQKLAEMFGRTPATNSGSSAYSGSIAAAAANASAHQRRRMSVSSIGLSGTSPTQTSPFMPGRARQGSQSSSGSAGGTDDSAIDESGDSAGPPTGSQFTRRLSFGARAMRDARAGSGGIFGNGRTPKSHSASRSVSSSVFSPPAVSGASATTSTPSSGRGTSAASSFPRASAAEFSFSFSTPVVAHQITILIPQY
jgi:hypothetical protein